MARSDKARLRELVNDYYHGLLTLESYRERRAQLLDNLGAMAEEAGATVPKHDRRAGPPIGTPAPAAKPEKSTPAGRRLLLGGAGALIAAAALAIAWLRMAAPEDAAATAPAGEAMARGDIILEEFLSRNEWSEDSLANFLITWDALGERQRAVSAEGLSYRLLARRVHQLIREEAALGKASTRARLQTMLDFAERIGAPYRGADVFAAPPPDTEQASSDGAGTDRAEPGPNDEPERPAVTARAGAPEAAGGNGADHPETAPGPTGVTASSPAAAPAVSRDDPCPADLANSRQPYCSDRLASGADGPPLVVLHPGVFRMGSEAMEEESPVHRVTIDAPIAISVDEISVAEYRPYCRTTDEGCPANPWGAGDYPVVSVSWDDAAGFAEWLSRQTGFRYRLPTEAEWEYAVRGGTTTPYYFGDEITPSAANSSVNGAEAPMPRSDRQVNRNPFRLYHMSGNVREWVQDDWYGTHDGAPTDGSARTRGGESLRVVRGGSYADPAMSLRSAARRAVERTHEDVHTGFRIVREVNDTSR